VKEVKDHLAWVEVHSGIVVEPQEEIVSQ